MAPCAISLGRRLRPYWWTCSTNHASSGVINLDIAKGLIASQLNLTQEHFSRILNELHRFGLIILDGRRIEIPKVDALQAYIPATA